MTLRKNGLKTEFGCRANRDSISCVAFRSGALFTLELIGKFLKKLGDDGNEEDVDEENPCPGRHSLAFVESFPTVSASSSMVPSNGEAIPELAIHGPGSQPSDLDLQRLWLSVYIGWFSLFVDGTALVAEITIFMQTRFSPQKNLERETCH